MVGRPWALLLVVSVPVFVGALDLTVASAVLPAVISDLRIPLQSGLDDASWVVSGYFLTYALGILIMGRASDHLGRRVAFLLSLAIFFAGSAAAAASIEVGRTVADALASATPAVPDRSFAALYTLAGARAIQGFGAGAMVPVAMALVGDLFPAGRRALPLGFVAAVDTVGWALGHLYGGLLVQGLAWPWIFWLNLPVVAVAFALVAGGVRGVQRSQVAGDFDRLGVVLAGVVLVALNIALAGTEVGPGGLAIADRSPAYAGPALLLAAVGLVAFVLAERRARAPLLDPRTLIRGRTATAVLLNFLMGISLIAALVSVPLLMNAAGASTTAFAALASGYALATFTMPMALAALLGGWASARAGARITTVVGSIVATTGFVLLARAPADAPRQVLVLVGGRSAEAWAAVPAELVAMAVALSMAGFGLGLTIAPLAAVVVEAAGPSGRGMAAATVIATRLLGMMVGVSALTTFGVRRWSALAPSEFGGIPLSEVARLAEVAFALTARIAAEMALIAAAVSAAALLLTALSPGLARPTAGRTA